MQVKNTHQLHTSTEDKALCPTRDPFPLLTAERVLEDRLINDRHLVSLEATPFHKASQLPDRRIMTINENVMLRTLLSSLYHIIESIRRPDVLAKCTHVSDFSASRLEQLQQQFFRELREPIECAHKPLLVFFLDMIPPFIRGSVVRIPVKKVCLCMLNEKYLDSRSSCLLGKHCWQPLVGLKH